MKKAKDTGLTTERAVSLRAPLEEPGCRVVDGVHRLLLAACKGQLEFITELSNYGLLQYGTDKPSDIGVTVWLQPLTDAAFHSRKHREAEEEAKTTLAYRESMRERDEAQRQTEKKIEHMDRVDRRYKLAGREGSIEDGLFSTDTKDTDEDG